MRRRTLLACLPLATLATAKSAYSQDFPAGPVRLVVPFGTGGTLGVIARLFQDNLSQKWGRQLIVDHRPGAGGNLGAEMVARARPDGHTLLFTTQALAVNATLTPTSAFEPATSFTPIVYAAAGQNVLVVSEAQPVRSLSELVALARTRPEAVTYASVGSGSTSQLAAELFSSMAGMRALNIPYTGAAQAATDVLAGLVTFWITTLGSVLGPIQQGQLRALAISGDRRSPALPGVPTFAEAGYPNFQAAAWFGVFAPAATPQSLVVRLNADFNEVIASPLFVQRLSQLSLDTVGGPPEVLGTLLAEEIPRWASVLRAAGLAPG
jgi:tripartite-type tricarboxylate transporter receptor subunit TctC